MWERRRALTHQLGLVFGLFGSGGDLQNYTYFFHSSWVCVAEQAEVVGDVSVVIVEVDIHDAESLSSGEVGGQKSSLTI